MFDRTKLSEALDGIWKAWNNHRPANASDVGVLVNFVQALMPDEDGNYDQAMVELVAEAIFHSDTSDSVWGSPEDEFDAEVQGVYRNNAVAVLDAITGNTE